MGALTDFLGIMQLQRVPDDDLVGQLGERLNRLIKLRIEQPQNMGVREFARALVALSYLKKREPGLPKEAARLLQKLENVKEGGWPSGIDGDPSVVPTAYVVEALRVIDPNGSADLIRRGERFLELRVSDGGWQKIGTGADVFAQATVLRVIARCAALETMEAGLAALKAAGGENGWGFGPQQFSTIEATSTVLLALSACGENRFVPYRVAAGRLSDVLKRSQALETEFAKLKHAFDRQVTRESGAILADRDRLRGEVKEQERKMSELELALRTAQREALEASRRSRVLVEEVLGGEPWRQSLGAPFLMRQFQLYEIAFVITVGVIGIGMFGSNANVRIFGYGLSGQAIGVLICLPAIMILWSRIKISLRFATLPFYLAMCFIGLSLFFEESAVIVKIFGFDVSARSLGIVLAEVGGILFMFQIFSEIRFWRTASGRLRAIFFGSDARQGIETVSLSVLEYLEIANSLPIAVREEFSYVLFNRIVDMPKDVGIRYTQDTLDRLGVPPVLQRRLLSWITEFLQFESFSRRAVLEQIRRRAQPT